MEEMVVRARRYSKERKIDDERDRGERERGVVRMRKTQDRRIVRKG